MKFVTAYSKKTKVSLGNFEKSRTKESFAREANVNFIVDRYRQTGAAEHLRVHEGSYGEFNEIDYHTALNAVTKAQQMFDSLPSDVRSRFDNDPGAFVDFATAEENIPEMRDMGFARPENQSGEGAPGLAQGESTETESPDSE